MSIMYNGVEVIKEDGEILLEIENILGKSIPRFNEIEYNEFGYVIDGQKGVVQLGLSELKLESFPESITRLKSLSELYLSGNQLKFLPESISATCKAV